MEDFQINITDIHSKFLNAGTQLGITNQQVLDNLHKNNLVHNKIEGTGLS